MATIDQKVRFRQRSLLRDRSDLVRRYCDLNETPGGFLHRARGGFRQAANWHFCPDEKTRAPPLRECGKEMRFTYSLPRTDTLQAMQAFRCDRCNETMIWKER
jgi:hypothetical protein